MTGFDSMIEWYCKQVVVRAILRKNRFKTINAEDIMSIPTSLTRGRNVFASNAELAVA